MHDLRTRDGDGADRRGTPGRSAETVGGSGPLRVGVLVHALSGGGGEAVARCWGEQLSRRGHDVWYLLYGADGGGVDLPGQALVLPGHSTFRRWVLLPGSVRRCAAERRLDVVLSVLDFSNLTALRALARPGPRSTAVVLSEHTVPTVHWCHEGRGGRVKKQLAKVLYRRADGVVAVSHPVATDLRSGYGIPAERLFVLPNPVPGVEELPAVATAGSGGLHRIVVVGRLSQVKRVDRLLAVLVVLRSRGLGCPALVIGDGPARAGLEQRARELRLPVQFLGWAARWQEHARPGDCLLVTADVEGFGNVLVEAAAAGVPAVAPSTALGVADALVPGLTGVLARSPDAEDLADALVEAAALAVRPELLQPWLTTFSPERAGARLEAVLTRVQQRRPPSSVRWTADQDPTAGSAPPAADLPRQIVTHVGPRADSQGGMATVLRSYREMRSSHHERRFLGSYSPDSPLWSALPFLRVGARLLRARGEELGIVHAHLSFGGSFVREGALMAIVRARGFPVVVTLHGSDFLEFLAGHPRLVRRVLGAADRIVVLSDEVRRRLPAALNARAVVVPNPVVVPHPAPPPAGEAPPVVLFAGEVALRKGVDVLLQAWPQVLASVPGARLMVAGPPGQVDAVAPVEMPGVQWLGAVGNGEVRRLLCASRAAVLPSRREAMPVFLLEAMAAARPVVTTAVGAIPETVGAGGLVVAPGDPDALAAALVDLLTHPEVATRLGVRGRERVLARYSLDAVADLLEVLYDGVVGTSPDGRPASRTA